MRNYAAANKLESVRHSVAFSIPEATRRKLNNYATLYTFTDGSCLLIKFATGCADTWHPAWTGQAHDIALGPNMNVPIRVNMAGA